jgi:hypothetical protein
MSRERRGGREEEKEGKVRGGVEGGERKEERVDGEFL